MHSRVLKLPYLVPVQGAPPLYYCLNTYNFVTFNCVGLQYYNNYENKGSCLYAVLWNIYLAPLQGVYIETLSALANVMLPVLTNE